MSTDLSLVALVAYRSFFQQGRPWYNALQLQDQVRYPAGRNVSRQQYEHQPKRERTKSRTRLLLNATPESLKEFMRWSQPPRQVNGACGDGSTGAIQFVSASVLGDLPSSSHSPIFHSSVRHRCLYIPEDRWNRQLYRDNPDGGRLLVAVVYNQRAGGSEGPHPKIL